MEGTDVDTGDVIRREFPVGANSELVIGNVSGSIQVRGDQTAESISVHAVKSGSARARENTRIEIEQHGDRISIQSKPRNEAKGFIADLSALARGFSLSAVEYDIIVPARCSVDANCVSASVDVSRVNERVNARSVSGSIGLADIGAKCEAHSVSGEVDVRNVAGDVVLESTSGSVTARKVQGAASITTVSGEIRIMESDLPRVDLHTVSGDVFADTPLTSGGQYRVKTVSGDVRLDVDGGSGSAIHAKSQSGDVHVSGFAMQAFKEGRKSWRGEVGDGSASVEVNTVSGDINIDHGTSTGVAASSDQSRRTTSSEGHLKAQTDVLRALQAGELNVEDAMEQLDRI